MKLNGPWAASRVGCLLPNYFVGLSTYPLGLPNHPLALLFPSGHEVKPS